MNKNETLKQDELVDIDNVEIQPLADEDLENVVGGLCSGWSCSNGKVAQNAVAEG
jgi:hypothetical protein